MLLSILILAAIGFIIISSVRWSMHPFLSLLIASLGVGLISGQSPIECIEYISSGFGGILGKIGLIVILGSIIGVVLERSGATMRIAMIILDTIGKRFPVLAMSIIGAIVSIPVFCDSGFVILSGLTKPFSDKTKISQGAYALALATGLYTSHTLIPPTPGPIAVAGNIGAMDHLGIIMLVGFITALFPLVVSWRLSVRWGSQLVIEKSSAPTEETLPPTLPSILPILLPILLISLSSVFKILSLSGKWADAIYFIGHPVVALLCGLIATWPLLRLTSIPLKTCIEKGIIVSGPILILTGIGAAFGTVLKGTQIDEAIRDMTANQELEGLAVLIIAFIVSAILKTAQGSSTSAMVITSSIVAPFLISSGVTDPWSLSALVMAIGGGAMTVSHTNDSYFWVVSKFSGIPMKSMLRSYTLITAIQGICIGMISIIIYILSNL